MTLYCFTYLSYTFLLSLHSKNHSSHVFDLYILALFLWVEHLSFKERQPERTVLTHLLSSHVLSSLTTLLCAVLHFHPVYLCLVVWGFLKSSTVEQQCWVCRCSALCGWERTCTRFGVYVFLGTTFLVALPGSLWFLSVVTLLCWRVWWVFCLWLLLGLFVYLSVIFIMAG